jgi:hypothetical protein
MRKKMLKSKLQFAVLGLFAVALLSPAMVSAHRYNRKSDLHPLRVIAYGANAVGIAAEYVIARPIHWVVSRKHLDIVFGHKSYVEDDPYYFEWVHGDYSPTVGSERTE